MSPIRQAVVDGTNEFLREQSAEPGPCRVTLAQFDSRHPFELMVEGIHMEKMRPLGSADYSPRGGTPLYDAIGSMIELADRRIEWCQRHSRPDEQHTVMIFTNGLENASRQYDRQQIFNLITDRQQAGWVFVFLGALGANQDSYATGRALGIDQRSSQNFDPTEDGVRAATRSVSRALSQRRRLRRDAPDEERADLLLVPRRPRSRAGDAAQASSLTLAQSRLNQASSTRPAQMIPAACSDSRSEGLRPSRSP